MLYLIASIGLKPLFLENEVLCVQVKQGARRNGDDEFFGCEIYHDASLTLSLQARRPKPSTLHCVARWLSSEIFAG